MSQKQSKEYNIVKFGQLDDQTFKIVEKPQPNFGANEVLVKMHAVSLQYRDLLVAWNKYGGAGQLEGLVPCSDGAGEIIAVGSAVKNWAVGQRVCANFCLDHLDGDTTPAIQETALGANKTHGVLAQYKAFPAHSLVEIPEYMSYEEASTLPCAALTAYNALHGPKPLKGGDFVLVLGTGGVSISALQIAEASGATVIATSSSNEKLKIASKLGAKHVINYNNVKDWDQEVLKITGGRGVDHVIEVGGYGTLHRSLQAVRLAGYVHLIGFVAQENGNKDLFYPVIKRGVTLRGIQIGSIAQFKDMNRLFSAQSIKPVIDKVFSFEEALAAYKHLESQKHVGKVVIKISHD